MNKRRDGQDGTEVEHCITLEAWERANGYDRRKRRYRKPRPTPRAVPHAHKVPKQPDDPQALASHAG